MMVTDITRQYLAAKRCRRTTDEWEQDGFFLVHEDGHPLWNLRRGDWVGRRIAEVRISPNGVDLWIKLAPDTRSGR